MLKCLNNKNKIYYFNTENLNAGSSTDSQFVNTPVLSAYLRELSIYNREIKGLMDYYTRVIAYNFNHNTNKISSSVFEFLSAVFLSMRCLISKPIFIFTPDKISIHLFYFLMVANKNTLKNYYRKIHSNYYLSRSGKLKLKRRNKRRNLIRKNKA